MPAPIDAYEAIAVIVGGVTRGDNLGIERFFEIDFPRMPLNLRSALSDWLACCNSAPDTADIEQLRNILSSSGFHISHKRNAVPSFEITGAYSSEDMNPLASNVIAPTGMTLIKLN